MGVLKIDGKKLFSGKMKIKSNSRIKKEPERADIKNLGEKEKIFNMARKEKNYF
jgi:hypothetical protein